MAECFTHFSCFPDAGTPEKAAHTRADTDTSG